MKGPDSPDWAGAIGLVRDRLKAARDRRTRAAAETPLVGSRTAGFLPALLHIPEPVELGAADTQWGDTEFESSP